ncbi:site-specific recombinase, phage integrase family [Rhodobacteraceae bacterium KLH11]|nr:site-specific recombinase, phage integrase family [Rhodobacteraceae bacterium KLH11]
MATILERERKDGSTAYVAQIVIKKKGHKPHREARTFDKLAAAKAWAKKRTKELKAPNVDFSKIGNRKRPKLRDAISRYISEYSVQMGRTKTQCLNTILEFDIADMACDDIRSHHLVEFARELGITRTAATVSNYMSHLGAVFTLARPAWDIALDPQAMKDAFVVCNRLGITGKAHRRDRRPTISEINRLMEYFDERCERYPDSIPMHRITGFAIFSTRRQEEIARIEWDGLMKSAKRVLVKDLKHPGKKKGNDVYCDLPDPAFSIAEAMPKSEVQVFPFNHRTISSHFTRACKFLEIENLRFHDLRHDGISRLFEMGLTIPQVAAVSGHRSWQSLQRYTHIEESGDKYENWEWVERIIQTVK